MRSHSSTTEIKSQPEIESHSFPCRACLVCLSKYQPLHTIYTNFLVQCSYQEFHPFPYLFLHQPLILKRLLSFLAPAIHSIVPSCQPPFLQYRSFHISHSNMCNAFQTTTIRYPAAQHRPIEDHIIFYRVICPPVLFSTLPIPKSIAVDKYKSLK